MSDSQLFQTTTGTGKLKYRVFAAPTQSRPCAVQVTSEEVRLLEISKGAVVGTWQCPEGRSIAKVASTGSCHLLVATGQGHVYLLETGLSGMACVASTELNVDIACLDIAHWEEPGTPPRTLLRPFTPEREVTGETPNAQSCIVKQTTTLARMAQ